MLCVKEIPPRLLVPAKPYFCFPHVTKGQPNNMPLLRRILATQCTLIDYERIVDRFGKRLIFFGRHAGYAGMIDALWALGQRMRAEGVETAFADVQPSHRYRTWGKPRSSSQKRWAGKSGKKACLQRCIRLSAVSRAAAM